MGKKNTPKKPTDSKSKGLYFSPISEVFCILCQLRPRASQCPSLPICKMDTLSLNMMGYSSKEKCKRF